MITSINAVKHLTEFKFIYITSSLEARDGVSSGARAGMLTVLCNKGSVSIYSKGAGVLTTLRKEMVP